MDGLGEIDAVAGDLMNEEEPYENRSTEMWRLTGLQVIDAAVVVVSQMMKGADEDGKRSTEMSRLALLARLNGTS